MKIAGQMGIPPAFLDYVRIAADGNLKMNLDILAEARYKFSASFDKQIGSVITLGTFKFAIGPVPISITPKIGLRASGQVEAQVQGSMTVGFDYSKYVEFGQQYRMSEGSFRAIKPTSTSQFNYHVSCILPVLDSYCDQQRNV